MYIHTKLNKSLVNIMEPYFKNKYGFHCTLMYDERNILYPHLPSRTKFTARVKDICFLGEQDILALELESPELEEFHKKLCEIGYKHSFEDFLPHMSLEYDFNKFSNTDKVEVAKLFIGAELEFNNVYISEVKND